MSLRFLKKLNGEKILQEYSHAKLEYQDVPLVEESGKERLLKALHAIDRQDKHRGMAFVILLSYSFHEYLKMEYTAPYSSAIGSDITSFYSHRVFVVTAMVSDFKICKEI